MPNTAQYYKSGLGHAVTRIAPSPTGNLHIGTARTALFNYIYARQNNGKFIVRIEDTDEERSKKEFEDNILNGLKWLGINHDELYRQSERGDIYKKYLEQLLKDGKAYVAEDNIIRLRNPGGKVAFNDGIRGEITFDTTELGDFVIAKSINRALYHLAVVVDDREMGVTHVIRGEDHISNTPRQILIGEALGFGMPQYTHLPLILAPDKSKLSKRHGAIAVSEYERRGYLPGAMINFMALLGWSPQSGGDNTEIFSLKDLLQNFDLAKIQKSGAIFNIQKLNSINSEYIRLLDVSKLAKITLDYVPGELRRNAESNMERWRKIIEIEQTRMQTLDSITTEDISFYFTAPNVDAGMLSWKDSDAQAARRHLKYTAEMLGALKDFTSHNIKEAIWNYAEEEGKGDVLWPMRVALTGREKSPDPFAVASVLGKDETIRRIHSALDALSK